MILSKKNGSEKRSVEAIRCIREWIVNNYFKEGELLSEVTLAEELKMSRTPIREAITYLCNEGLLDTIPGRGAVVARMSQQDIEEILDLREVLEPLAAASAINRIPDKEIENQMKLWIQAKVDAEKGIEISAENFAKWDTQLHGMLRDYCTNERLREFLNILNIQTGMFVIRSWGTKAFITETINQHIEILKGLRDRDYNFLKRSLVNHIRSNMTYHLGR
ncbi:MAG: GntR family transcriptional regulator [Synergistaceae bacterium]|nr:GntR family transcriptional regulator [Synergistaceae bacterium]